MGIAEPPVWQKAEVVIDPTEGKVSTLDKYGVRFVGAICEAFPSGRMGREWEDDGKNSRLHKRTGSGG